MHGEFLPSLNVPEKILTLQEKISMALLMAMTIKIKSSSYYELVMASENNKNEICENISWFDSNKQLRSSEDLVQNEIQVAKELINSDYSFSQTDFFSNMKEQNTAPRFKDKRYKSESLYIPLDLAGLNPLIASCQLIDITRGQNETREPSNKGEEIRKAIMFDLDSTLIDSSQMRRACWLKGLSVFFEEVEKSCQVKSKDIEDVYNIYEKFVYKNYKKYSNIFKENDKIPSEWQHSDFRQVWNHPYAWAVLLWILDNNAQSPYSEVWKPESWSKTYNKHKVSIENNNEENCRCNFCKTLRDNNIQLNDNDQINVDVKKNRRSLVLSFRARLRYFGPAIKKAREAFWTIKFPCNSQTRSCIKALRAIPKAEVYIVTEGHEETQLNKLRCASIEDLFPSKLVLSTGAASSPEEAITDLDEILNNNKRELNALEEGNAEQSAIKKREDTIDAIKLYLKLLKLLSEKQSIAFYSAVIDSIQLNPIAPAQVLHSFTERRRSFTERQKASNSNTPNPIKFYMVGDRYDNDCKPLLEIFDSGKEEKNPRVGTCRLLSGKRSLDQCPPKDKKGNPERSTSYVCDTLMQIVHILNNPDSWKAIKETESVRTPVLLNEKSNTIYCGKSKPAESDVELSNQFKYLAWATAETELYNEKAVQEITAQIIRDIAVCSPEAQCRFFSTDHFHRGHGRVGTFIARLGSGALDCLLDGIGGQHGIDDGYRVL